MSSARLFDVRVLLVGFLVAAGLMVVAAAGFYNVHIELVQDMGTNSSNFPWCDNGDSFFLTYFFEWASGGRMVAGQDCRIAGVSAEIVAQWTEQELIDQGIDPELATPGQIIEARNTVLLRWAAKIMGR